MDDIKDLIKEISTLELGDDDVLLFKFNDRLNESQLGAIRENLSQIMPEVKVLLIDENVDVSVITKNQAESLIEVDPNQSCLF
jgi:hypothetical protein